MRQLAESTFAKASLNRNYSFEAAFPWLLALLAVGYIAFHCSDPVTLAPDSGGYLQFSEHRTAGYPLFLRAVETLFRTTDAVQKAQLVIAASAFAFLGWSVHRAFRSPFFALAPVVALILYPRIADLPRLHPHRVHLHLAAVPDDRGHRALGPPPDLAMDRGRGARLRPGDYNTSSRHQPFGDMAVPVLARLEALRRAPAGAGCGGCRAHRPLPGGRERDLARIPRFRFAPQFSPTGTCSPRR